MQVCDFDFELPAELIAQTPSEPRDASRLLVLAPGPAPLAHHRFADIVDLLPAGALVVLNDTKVMAARLFGQKPTGGRVEILLVSPVAAVREPGQLCETWSCLVRSPPRPGTWLRLVVPAGRPPPTEPAPHIYYVGPSSEDDLAVLEFRTARGLVPALPAWGEIPLPPYIERAQGPTAADPASYQTVFAREDGAVAAPTAGLHFTQDLLAALGRRCPVVTLTLHVGPGTFLPVRGESLAAHKMHRERYQVSDATRQAFAAARREGRPIVAVGTTVARALESAFDPETGELGAGPGQTDLFITPGYRFRAVDRLITNFHLPRSTLLMLVCALGGTDRVLAAYRTAIAEGYRFYSFGDAMLVW